MAASIVAVGVSANLWRFLWGPVADLTLTARRGAASTKYATLSSLGNIPVVYMTALNGWVHDRFGTAWMLHSEALLGIGCVGIAVLVLGQINAARVRD
jgi:hypothetical protein